MAEDKKFKGLWIPKNLLALDVLKLSEKVFLSEVFHLSQNKAGACNAGNDHFAGQYGMSKKACSKIINNLVRRDWLNSNIFLNSQRKTERHLRLTAKGVSTIVEGVYRVSTIVEGVSTKSGG